MIIKWRDIYGIHIIIRHTDYTLEMHNRSDSIIYELKAVEDYNIRKPFFDRFDQMTSYSFPLIRSLKWYQKMGFHLYTVINICCKSPMVI